jgi:hypothetical protein
MPFLTVIDFALPDVDQLGIVLDEGLGERESENGYLGSDLWRESAEDGCVGEQKGFADAKLFF